MTESLINEWLADCKDVAPSELHMFARTLSQDNEIVRALYMLLEERTKYSELMDEVCNQLYNFYRSREIELQRFTLQFLPTLIYIYLNSAAHGDIKNCRSLETLLIGLYNLEVVDKSGQQKAISFRLPSLAMLSIYHEPASLAPASLTESAVRRFEECNSKLVSWGPLQQVETLNAQNRLKVMTALLFIYNQQLGYINKFALEQLCKVATKLVTQGFMKPGHHQRSSYGSESSFVPRLLPRIPVSSQFLLEFLHAVYFAMYNDCWYVGTQAIEDVHNRACYEAYPNVMLVTNAIRNSASSGAPGQPSDGPIGISVALSPATTTPTISKSMITNASFRTKKLPDDLDEKLFAVELSNCQAEKQQRPAVSSSHKRRPWHWKHALPNSVDKKDTGAAKAQSSSSLESSRRGSICSNSQSSPIKSSPKKSKDQQSKKTAIDNKDDISQKTRKESNVMCDSTFSDDRLAANAHLYSLLEEQALGEIIRESVENVYTEGNSRLIHYCATAALPSNTWYYHSSYNTVGWHDIPIQVIKDDTTGEGKGNLVSIMEESESTEPNRIGSMRQSKDQKTASKITNFPVLGKKPKEKEGKVAKNTHVASEKEKKLGSQATSKESIKGSLSMLNSEQQAEIDANVNGCAIRKKNNVENNAIIIDPNVALIDGERLALSRETDVTDGSNIENSINLRAHNETESIGSSIQISSV
ncbi:PREDICTED: hyccin isoform X2 [Cyphomyrmex costatus]|uniref:Hyccin n=1 Tax=Cyphomyrmex costatus TaxID=456900 RepID=A0A151ICE9_9HYME|nr:PREDICTED: hyccin isoform X2 [Cyphomyrmex costatus]KYM97731.1 Hyccin [Cyphomyrmex costatus]